MIIITFPLTKKIIKRKRTFFCFINEERETIFNPKRKNNVQREKVNFSKTNFQNGNYVIVHLAHNDK